MEYKGNWEESSHEPDWSDKAIRWEKDQLLAGTYAEGLPVNRVNSPIETDWRFRNEIIGTMPFAACEKEMKLTLWADTCAKWCDTF